MSSNSINNSKSPSIYTDKNFYILCFCSMYAMLNQLVSAAKPEMAEVFNVTAAEIGYLGTVYTMPVLFMSPIVGILSDKFGRKKILFSSALLFGIGGVLCAYATSYKMLLFFNFVRGLGAPGLNVLGIALTGDLWKDKAQRTKVTGYRTALTDVGNAVFPILGGLLAGLSWKYTHLAFGIAIIGAITALFINEPPMTKKPAGNKEYMRDAFKYFKNKRVFALSFISFSVYLLLSGCFLAYTPFLTKNVLKAPAFIGTIMATQAVSSCIFSSQLGNISKKIPLERMCKISLAAFFISFFIASQINSIEMLLAFAAVFGIGVGLNMPPIMTMTYDIAPREQRGIFMALYNMIKRLGQMVGPIVFGLFFTLGGLDLVFKAAMVISLIILIFALIFLKTADADDNIQRGRA